MLPAPTVLAEYNAERGAASYLGGSLGLPRLLQKKTKRAPAPVSPAFPSHVPFLVLRPNLHTIYFFYFYIHGCISSTLHWSWKKKDIILTRALHSLNPVVIILIPQHLVHCQPIDRAHHIPWQKLQVHVKAPDSEEQGKPLRQLTQTSFCYLKF